MQRVSSQRYAEAIAAALDHLPAAILGRLEGTHFLTGTSPIFAGLHAHEHASDGRRYRATAHVAYEWSQTCNADRRATTVVLPSVGWNLYPPVIVHELGHVLHEQLGFVEVHTAVTSYARTNPYEAFAEAFRAWVCPNDETLPSDRLHAADVALFESL